MSSTVHLSLRASDALLTLLLLLVLVLLLLLLTVEVDDSAFLDLMEGGEMMMESSEEEA